ncbi:alpha-L-rhamnosidase C-terminal domain-containing protein [Cohnella silvisoli]|uniref:Alpha-rhamnosidase n=1 Tax=Cohnella silvisoli TaxID=2873699 RepID=A0ABV1KNP7_9BACL|nr:alpha-L-rhamnosidase C-terminal domain-containing protein [Cohnella silvisoli]MCD9020438.1 alpha-rhamnosidase [Cohnella silvisoli]
MTNSQATWICYPNDYEHWLHAKASVKRQFRGYICPPFWRLDGAYSNVMFRKSFEIAEEETVTLSVQGEFVLHLDGSMIPLPYDKTRVTSVKVPAGQHELLVKVFNDQNVPSIYAESPSFVTDASWEATCHNGKWVPAAAVGFDDIASPPADFPFAYETRRPVDTIATEEGVVVDFGQETFGFVQLLQLTGRGKLRLYYGESLPEAMAGEMAETFDELMIDNELPQTVKTTVTRAFRYVNVQADPGLVWSEIVHDYEYLPVTQSGEFRSSDERLNRIWDVAVRTLHMNTREFMYDGLKRDRWVWSGDAYQSFLMNNYVFFDQNVTKRTLIALRGKEPVEMHINTIMDYTFYWFIAFYDYYMYTGDLVFIRHCYPQMLSLIDFCLKRRNDAGMMEGFPEDWVFIDWAPMELRGEVSTEQLLFCRSLETIALLAKELGDLDNESNFTKLATEMHERIMERFWDEEEGAFISGTFQGTRIGQILKYPSMFALRFGYLNESRIEAVKRNVMLNEAVQKITTPYMRFYELEAMCELGEKQRVLREIREYWGGMLDLGATTFWEQFDPELPAEAQYDMYGDKYRKSLCHAWGAAPLYLIGKYLIGVRPVGPGYSRYLLEPELGDLEWLEGTVPTPHGVISVYADKGCIRVATCAGGSGTLRFRSASVPETNEGEILSNGAGTYEIALVQPSFVYEVKRAFFSIPSG